MEHLKRVCWAMALTVSCGPAPTAIIDSVEDGWALVEVESAASVLRLHTECLEGMSLSFSDLECHPTPASTSSMAGTLFGGFEL